MKITIESTTKIVQLIIGDAQVRARVWQGTTESGIPVHAFITRIVPEVPTTDPDIDTKTAEFERDLARQAEPSVTVDAIPLRYIL